ncbi:MAG: hypothetical protein KGL35_11285 [Bradyrhizobium sp.]|nr:hypothetical protein [Pseudomonadota bacterium]MDE2469299.1 hypothetical protein [Bradyrhizobium sp.]
MQAAGANRHSQADLSRTLCHRNEQNIHDTNAVNDKRDRGDGRKQKRHDPARTFRSLDKLAQIPDLKIVDVIRLDAMPFS